VETFLTFLVLFVGSIIYAICKSKQRKPKSYEDFIIVKENKDAKPGELMVKLSLAPRAINELSNQLFEPDTNSSNHLFKQEELKIDKPKEYILRKKIYISQEDFRFEGEDDYIIRMEQNPPNGFNNNIFEKVMLKGISYSSSEESVNSFISGSNRSLILERSPSNQDKFGIKVIGVWQSTRKIRRAHLGWLPVIEAAQICTTYSLDLPLAATLRKIFKPRPGKNPGMRYDIWIP
jgi:hypothetical protein